MQGFYELMLFFKYALQSSYHKRFHLDKYTLFGIEGVVEDEEEQWEVLEKFESQINVNHSHPIAE